MKNLIYIVALIISSTSLFSQSTDALDTKNGFKSFTLGEPFSKWQNNLTYLKTRPDSMKLYQYTGDCCQTVFNDSVSMIVLYFFQNKLAIIEVHCNPRIISPEDGQVSSFLGNFKLLYGKPTGKTSEENNPEGKFQWEGKKVGLDINFQYIGYKVGYSPIVSIYDQGLVLQAKKSGF
jgi:hypothetical protein